MKQLLRYALAILILGFVGYGIFSSVNTGGNSQNASVVSLPHSDTTYKDSSEQQLNTLKDLNNSIANLAEKSKPTVVTVFTKQTVEVRQENPFYPFFGPRGQKREYERSGLGSGVITSEDGYILTNNHVVENADSVWVKLYNDKEVAAEIIGTDPRTDIAVLKINGEDLPHVEMGDSDALRVGEFVLAIGSPLSPDLAHSVSMGIVSAKGRSNLGVIQSKSRIQQAYENFIQTDAAINPGNSGGALVNLDGELVGINTAIASRSGGFQGIGLAIPSNMAQNVMNSLIEHGRVIRGYLGIYMQNINQNIANAYDLEATQGVIITDVVDDAPAAKAGLKSDDIIVKVNDTEIKNANQLASLVANNSPGTEIDIQVLRDGNKKTITVELGEMPQDQQTASAGGSVDTQDKVGFSVETLSDNMAEDLGLDPSIEGVVVQSINQQSEAYRAGLREGDVIVEANRGQVTNAQQFGQFARQLEQGNAVVLRVIRDQRVFLVDFRL